MRWILYLTMFVSLGFAPAPVYRPKPSLKYRDLLQGKWSLISSQSNNDPATKPDERVLVVRGSVCEIQEGSPTQSRYRIVRDETKNEGPLELHEEGNTDPNEKPYRGFYRVVGDELTLCLGSKRGETATSIKGGQGMERHVLKRSAKP